MIPCKTGAIAALVVFSCFAQEPQNAVASVSSALRTGQFETAVETADAALRSNPKDVRLLTLKAIGLTKLHRRSDALSAYRAALAIDSDYLPALAGVAELEYREGGNMARTHVDALLRLRPGDETAHAMRAVIAWKDRDCPTAVTHFAEATRTIESEPAALQEYGTCLVQLDRNGEALSVYQRLQQLQPDDRATRYALASMQLIDGKYADAIQTLEPLATKQDPEALKLSSEAEEKLGDTPRAVAMLRQAILVAPDRADLYVDFAAISFEHNSFKVGVDMINAGLTKLPANTSLYLARGVLEAQMGQYDKADRDFAKAESLDAHEAVGADAQALALFQADRLDKARTAVEAAIKKTPQDSFLFYLLAEILTRHGALPGSADFERAVTAAQTAVRLKPGFVLGRDTLSRLYLESGDFSSAIEQCRMTLKYDPNDQIALYRLLRALRSVSSESHSAEIKRLADRLAQIREEARRKEERANRYRLVEPAASLSTPTSNR